MDDCLGSIDYGKRFHNGAVAGMLVVVVLLLPPSSSM